MPPGFLLCSTGNKTLRIENNTIRNPLKKKMSVLYKNSARTAQWTLHLSYAKTCLLTFIR